MTCYGLGKSLQRSNLKLIDGSFIHDLGYLIRRIFGYMGASFNHYDVDKSCNFSYSEDSTIITDALSKAGIVSPEDLDEDDKRDNERSYKQMDDQHSKNILF